MDIIELLTKDHAEVNQLFGRFARASKPETLNELGKEIIHELSVHAAVEEQFVYPVIRRKVEGGGTLVDRAVDEHQQLKRLLSELEKADPSKAVYRSTMEKVAASVREHVKEEEGEVLPKLRESSSADFRKQIGALVQEAKVVVPTHPHPLLPGTATAQLLAGPWVSLVDRVRDLISA